LLRSEISDKAYPNLIIKSSVTSKLTLSIYLTKEPYLKTTFLSSSLGTSLLFFGDPPEELFNFSFYHFKLSLYYCSKNSSFYLTFFL